MAVRRNRRAQREAAHARSTWIAAAIVVAVLAVMLILYVQSGRDNPILAKDSLCPDAGPTAFTALVIDTTDPFGAVTRADVRSRLLAEVGRVPRFAKVEIYGAGAHENALLTPVFARCNPGRGSDVSSINASPELVERAYERDFRRPLEASLDRLLTPTSAPASPILEGVQAVAVSAFPPESDKKPRELFVVSDFLQNSKRFSMYRGLDPDQAATAAKALRPNIADVAVTMLVVGRDKDAAIQERPDFLDYWTQWFSGSGARVQHIVKLAGRN